MLIDEQYVKNNIIYNMKNYFLKDGDKIIFVGSHNIYTIGNEFTTDKSGKCIIDDNNLKFLSNYFVLVDRINKDNYWNYYYSNSYVCKLLKDYREINNNYIRICKKEQILGIKNRLENIIKYGLIRYINRGCAYMQSNESDECIKIKDLYFNLDYEYYPKECEELNISKYYYHDRNNNKLISFNNEEECEEFINRKVD